MATRKANDARWPTRTSGVLSAPRCHYPGRPRCCEVDDHHYFIDTVRAILAYGNKPEIVQQNAGTAGVRQALGALLDNVNLGGPAWHTVIYTKMSIMTTPAEDGR